MEQLVRVAVIADSSLIQHRLQALLVEAQYDVALCTSSERINSALLNNDTITIWVVHLDDEQSEFIDELLDLPDVAILFSDGDIPSKSEELLYNKWHDRLIDKLHAISPPSVACESGPKIDLENLVSEPKKVLKLPATIKFTQKTDVSQVWVLCASLGGPEAVKAFLDCLPKDVPAAFVYGQHIHAECLDALLVSIGRHCQLPFKYAKHGEQLENGSVLVVPVDHEIQIHENNAVQWLEHGWPGPYGPSHDQLLKNISDRYGDKSHCIIFSGMGSDGSIGATIMSERGGMVWAQSQEGCIQSSMPDSAYETGCVSIRMQPEELAQQFINKLSSPITSQTIGQV